MITTISLFAIYFIIFMIIFYFSFRYIKNKRNNNKSIIISPTARLTPTVGFMGMSQDEKVYNQVKNELNKEIKKNIKGLLLNFRNGYFSQKIKRNKNRIKKLIDDNLTKEENQSIGIASLIL